MDTSIAAYHGEREGDEDACVDLHEKYVTSPAAILTGLGTARNILSSICPSASIFSKVSPKYCKDRRKINYCSQLQYKNLLLAHLYMLVYSIKIR
jgi:hypothetical protein